MIYCPGFSCDCPYWREGNICGMTEHGFDPRVECEEFEGFGEDGEDE